jgi:hypothetical protein
MRLRLVPSLPASPDSVTPDASDFHENSDQDRFDAAVYAGARSVLEQAAGIPGKGRRRRHAVRCAEGQRVARQGCAESRRQTGRRTAKKDRGPGTTGATSVAMSLDFFWLKASWMCERRKSIPCRIIKRGNDSLDGRPPRLRFPSGAVKQVLSRNRGAARRYR